LVTNKTFSYSDLTFGEDDNIVPKTISVSPLKC